MSVNGIDKSDQDNLNHHRNEIKAAMAGGWLAGWLVAWCPCLCVFT